MKYLLYLHHPAHFHLFKNLIKIFYKSGSELLILATNKDILEYLLQHEGIDYQNVLPKGRRDNKISITLGLLKQDYRLFKICKCYKPSILFGTSTEITHIGALLNIPSLFINEDDIEAIPLVGKLAYPYATNLISPSSCSTAKWKNKTIFYKGYHELAYLHPNNFKADIEKVKEIISHPDEKFFIIRLAKLSAHHDVGKKGITNNTAKKIITKLSAFGKVLITSESELEPEFEQYRININPLHIHHAMAFATLYIGDSQTMAAEAAVLGTPSIRFNDFVGKLGYLEELEHKYGLTYGIKTSEPEKLFHKIDELLAIPNLKEEWQKRRQKMLSEKIDVTAFLVWFIENYPESVKVMKENPDYQYMFK